MEAKVKRQIVLLSILLHILFLAFWESFITLDIARAFPASPPVAVISAPLVFDLAQPELPREVIATPADAKTTDHPQKADFLSDKNALASNQEPAPANIPLGDEPYARGDFASHDLPPHPAIPEKEAAGVRPEEKTADADKHLAEADRDPLSEEIADFSLPRATPEAGQGRTAPKPAIPGVAHDHIDSQAADTSGLSFNTYNWDFAPYMLELKERIRDNIFPPMAFSQLGMIDGNTVLRFKIYPNGELRDLELLAYEGHRSLMETSTIAIKVSAPFRKLPGNFPEPYLQVTAKFSFFIKNKRG
ncbi:MAG: hypothetical protein NTZ12_02900 [Candidatus Aminicenantes bacterium]|nr:hypothetical protein [Candidatus Aminicenantes bacterium]